MASAISDTATREQLESIDRAIAEFDGRHVGPLERVVSDGKPSDVALAALIGKCGSGNEAMETAASWILKGYLERGAVPAPAAIDELVAAMAQISGWEARLHLAQAFQWLDPSEDQALLAAEILTRWFGSEKKFLRAWACDALWRLACKHQRLAPEARRIAALAEADPAASVRARARNLPRGP